ncbi:discoidin domain-containing protein [Thiolapillus brandeum]|nr:discoidin domain-containing protein [Thiolapillus brandeum]
MSFSVGLKLLALPLVLAMTGLPDVNAGESAAQVNVLAMKNGGVVLAHTSQYDKEYPVNAMIDGSLENYWASGKPSPEGPYPQSFVIEMDQVYALEKLVIDNRETDEEDYPGVSAREVRFSVSATSSREGWKPLLTVQALQFGRKEIRLPKPVNGRWLKVEIMSNYGNPMFVEINELEAYGQPVGKKAPFPDANGVYQTNYQLLMLEVDGEEVTGCYELDKGFVYGKTNGRVFDIKWVEHKGKESGTALLVSSSDGFLNGLWYEDGIMKGPWFGNKLPDRATIQCDPVSAAMGVGFNASTLVDYRH